MTMTQTTNHPFASRRATRVPQPSTWQENHANPEPIVRVEESVHEYTIVVEAPKGHDLDSATAVHDSPGGICISGRLRRLAPRYIKYFTQRRTPVYAEPSCYSCVGMVPAGTVLRGGMPASSGWIALDDDDWLYDDGCVEAVSIEQHPPLRFSRRVTVPHDADVEGASSRHASSRFVISIPKLRVGAQKRRPAPCVSRKVWEEGAARDIATQREASVTPTQRSAAASKASGLPKATQISQGVQQDCAQQQTSTMTDSPSCRQEYAKEHIGTRPSDSLVSSDILLIDTLPRAENVQRPHEECQFWVAKSDGGFKMA